jgi:hypothetical protein
LVAESTQEQLNTVYGDTIDSATIEKHEAVFRRPSFGDSIKLTGDVSLNSTSFNFNPFAIRLARMTTLIKRWTFFDEYGKMKDITPESISKLNPIIANIISSQLEDELGNI